MKNKDSYPKTSEWLTYLNDAFLSKNNGCFSVNDKLGKPIVLEWLKTNIQSPAFSKAMKSISEMACSAYLPVEMQFLRANPGVVKTEECFKYLEPFFNDSPDNIDWQVIEKKMKQFLEQIHTMDYSKYNSEDIYFFIIAKDVTTGEIAGFNILLVSQVYPFGDVKSISFAVSASKRRRGLFPLLMKATFKLIPNVKRVFFSTRVTNRNALLVFRAYGSIKDLTPIEDPRHKFNPDHWVSLEYKIKESDVLQNELENLEEIK